MPTYQYLCTSCKHTFEEFQSMVDSPLEICPECGGKIKRLISGGAGFIFKGSGFYQTDYRSEGYKKAAESEKKSTSKDTTKKKTETKTKDSKASETTKSTTKDKKKSA